MQSILFAAADELEIAWVVEIDLETLRENSAGDEVVIYRFRPVAAPWPTMRRRADAAGARFENAAVAGVGMVRFGMLREHLIMHLARHAGLAAPDDADMTLADVDEAFVGYIQLTSMLGIKAMKELGLTGLPVTHIEKRAGHRVDRLPRGGRGGAVGPCRRGDGAEADKFVDTARKAAAAVTRSTRPSSLRRTSPCGRSAACTSGAPRPSNLRRRSEELELRRALPVDRTGDPTTR